MNVCKCQMIWVPFRLTSIWRVTVSPIVPTKINTYVLMNDNPIPEDRKNLTPLNVMGLIQGEVFPRSAPSIGFPIKVPKKSEGKGNTEPSSTNRYISIWKTQQNGRLESPYFTRISGQGDKYRGDQCENCRSY